MNKRAFLVFSQQPEKEALRKRLLRGRSGRDVFPILKSNMEHVLNTTTSLSSTDAFLIHQGSFNSSAPHHIRYMNQDGRGLSDAMIQAATEVENQGYEEIFFLGADLPGLTSDSLQAAIDLLCMKDAVVGPGSDGGFYLVGVKTKYLGRLVEILSRTPLCTTKAYCALWAGLEKHKLNAGVLTPIDDVDSWADLLRQKTKRLWVALDPRRVRALRKILETPPLQWKREGELIDQQSALHTFATSLSPPLFGL